LPADGNRLTRWTLTISQTVGPLNNLNKPISYSTVAHLYDSYVNTDFDLSFFLKEAHEARGKILELACGTGRLSIPLLQAGIKLTCVDYSKEMLDIFREKLEKNHLSCRIFHQDMAELSLREPFDLILIPFHSFSEILDEAKQAQALVKIREHLADTGRFVCTLHNPIVRTRSMDGTVRPLGRFPATDGRTLLVSTCFKYDDRSQNVSGAQFYEVYDAHDVLVEKTQLDVSFHLFHKTQFEKLVLTAGFKVAQLYGDYQRSPFDDAKSPFIIMVLEKSDSDITPWNTLEETSSRFD
jgi:SAM-dependent methyltransferase